jgi:hypothetical protein
MGDSPKLLPLVHADRQWTCRTRLLPLRAMFFGNALDCHHWLIYKRKCAHDYCYHSRLLSLLKDDVREYETRWNLSLSLMLIANGDNVHVYGRTCCDKDDRSLSPLTLTLRCSIEQCAHQPLCWGQPEPEINRRRLSGHLTQQHVTKSSMCTKSTDTLSARFRSCSCKLALGLINTKEYAMGRLRVQRLTKEKRGKEC